jgi:antitoxin component of RelBE/YafQ-DinJ toxin-antitoxin module
MQLNLRVDEKSLQRFTNIADDEGLIFGDLFKKLLDKYASK